MSLCCSVISDFLDPVGHGSPGSSSMEFSRQEYQSWLPFPSPGNLPNPGIKPRSPTLQADSLLFESPGTYNFRCYTVNPCCLSTFMYSSLYLLIPYSSFVPLSLSLSTLATINLFSTSVSLFLRNLHLKLNQI